MKKWTISFCSELKQLFTYSPIHFSGNKMEKWTTFVCSELKQLFTYSPIHFSGNKMEQWTTFVCSELKQLHLFTYSLSGNKITKWTTFSWSELKQLFTYSPIHLFTYFRGGLGVQNQKGRRSVYGRQNWAYVAKKAAGILVDTVLPHYRVAICVPHKDRTTPLASYQTVPELSRSFKVQ